MNLTLYTRTDCCLCLEAGALMEGAGIAYTPVNIEADLTLIQRFGNLIPVVENPQTGDTLSWPFDVNRLRVLLNGQ